MGILLTMIWVLPLFKAQPLLAPIYNPVDRMVPPSFPLLLVVPGVAIDLVMMKYGTKGGFWRDWLLAAALGTVFLVAFMAVQYPFAGFLISPAAENWFFAGNRWLPYFIKPGDWITRFWGISDGKDLLTIGAVGTALTLGVVKARIALAVGAWMSNVQR